MINGNLTESASIIATIRSFPRPGMEESSISIFEAIFALTLGGDR